MPITKFIQSLNGTCRHCGQKTGLLQRDHPQCRQTHQAGMNEMTQLAAQAAGTSSFNEQALRSTLQAIATRARATAEDISQAIADGWAQGVKHAMQDGTLTAGRGNEPPHIPGPDGRPGPPQRHHRLHHPGPGFS